MSTPGLSPSTARRSHKVAWALWDTGATGINAVVVTFVFSVYLVNEVGTGEPGGATPASWLGRAMAVAGVTIALVAPLTGVWVDVASRRRATLAALTGAAVVLTASMSLIRADPSYLWVGLVLLAMTAACMELATVPYNAMLRQLAKPADTGRLSGLGMAAGYLGSVVLLLAINAGFIGGDGATRGLLEIPAADGQNFRAAMLLTAAWFAVFALPVLVMVRPPAQLPAVPAPRIGLLGAYRKLWSDIKTEWRRDHNVVYFLLASALFRDGLAGVFAFAAVVGTTVYGISAANATVFGATASVVALVGAVLGGLADHRIGSKTVIVGSLASMIAIGLTLLVLSGPGAFWVCGLLLSLFIGPAQASARALLLRLTADGKEGVAFGLYSMTGRALSFLAPFLFALFIDIFGTDRAGLGGLLTMLVAGLVALLLVRVPASVTVNRGH